MSDPSIHVSRQDKPATHNSKDNSQAFPFFGQSPNNIPSCRSITTVFPKPPKMEYLCIQGEKTLRTSDELDVHRSYHHGKNQFSCSHCEKLFTKYVDLKTHIMTHIGENGYDCLQCGKVFKTLQNLKHTNDRTLARSLLSVLSVTNASHSLFT